MGIRRRRAAGPGPPGRSAAFGRGTRSTFKGRERSRGAGAEDTDSGLGAAARLYPYEGEGAEPELAGAKSVWASYRLGARHSPRARGGSAVGVATWVEGRGRGGRHARPAAARPGRRVVAMATAGSSAGSASRCKQAILSIISFIAPSPESLTHKC